MMGGKHWALQSGTSHNLGDHFGRVFGIRFLDRDGERKFAFNTSWGLSHRVVGATIMVHGDERGLKLPPRVAPVQVVIVPIWRNGEERRLVEAARTGSNGARPAVARVQVDWRDDQTPGCKFNEWELKGVPLRLEIGPRDVAADQVVLVRRDTREKTAVPVRRLPRQSNAWSNIQAELLRRPTRCWPSTRPRSRRSTNWPSGWRRTPAGRSPTGAATRRAKRESRRRPRRRSAASRTMPLREHGRCLVCGDPSETRVVVARAY